MECLTGANEDAAGLDGELSDRREHGDSELKRACEYDGVCFDEVLDLHGQIDSLIRRGEKKNPGLRRLIVSRTAGLKREVAFKNMSAWYRLVGKIHRMNVADPIEDDVLFMVSYLVAYEGLYARVIDVLYEAAKALEPPNRKRRRSTGRKAECLAEKGIDMRAAMKPDVRNAAAHLRFAAGGGLIGARREGGKEGDLIVTMNGKEFGMDEARNVPGAERITHRDIVYSEARRSAATLYRALVYWCYIHGDATPDARPLAQHQESGQPAGSLARDAVQHASTPSA